MQEANGSTRHITTILGGDRLLRQVFEDGDRNENTVSQYCKHVMRLFQGLHRQRDFENLDWI